MAALTSSKAVWDAIGSMFTSTSCSRINNLRIALANGRKENKTVAAYFAEMKSYAEERATTGKPLAEDELISYILAGLDENYNPLVSALDARPEEVSLDELFAQMSNFDQRAELLGGSTMDDNGGFKSSANYSASCGHGRGRGGPPRGRGNGGRGRNRGGRPPFYNNNRGAPPSRNNSHGGGGQGSDRAKIPCQICGKLGHNARDCWYRYSDDQEERTANIASYGVDTDWYMDSGATDHVTSELEKVTIRDK